MPFIYTQLKVLMNEKLQLSLENEPVFKIALSTNVAATF